MMSSWLKTFIFKQEENGNQNSRTGVPKMQNP